MGVDPQRLQAFLERAGLRYKTNSRSFIFTCPVCHKPDRLYIFKSTGKFNCFRCNANNNFRGAPEFALAKITDLPLETVRTQIYGDLKPQATAFLDLDWADFFSAEDAEPVDEDFVAFKEQAIPLPDNEWPPDHYPMDHEFAADGRAYLVKRGIPPRLARQYDIRYVPRKRVIAFPVWINQKLTGWQYRIIDPEVTKNPDGTITKRGKAWSGGNLPKSRTVMFSHRLDGFDHAVICEGPIDAIKAHLVGGNIATMGKAVDKKQVEILLQAGIRKFYIALDDDAAEEINPLLRKFGVSEAYKVEIPQRNGQKTDLGKLSFGDAQEYILSAKKIRLGQLHLHWKNASLFEPKGVF